MTAETALVRVAAAAAEAVAQALVARGVEAAVVGGPAVLEDIAAASASLPVPGLAVTVAFTGGITASNVLVLPAAVAASIAAAGGANAADERRAVGAVVQEALAAAAQATGSLLQAEVTAGPAELRALVAAADAAAPLDAGASGVVLVELALLGGRAYFVQLLPHASVVRTTGALDDLVGDVAAPAAGVPAAPVSDTIGGAVLATKLRVWAEIGRARLPAGRVVSLPGGSVVELDRLAEDPVDVYVNGHHYATGRLVVDEGGEWAVRIEQLVDRPSAA